MWASGCLPRPGVVRVVEGQDVEGQFVGEEAYAFYVRGALLEAEHDYAGASVAYAQALGYDPESRMLWVRLAAVHCELGMSAQAELSAAMELDPAFAPAWYESARCALRAGAPTRARTLAETALRLDPDDEATVLLLASIEQSLKRPDRSASLLLTEVARSPQSVSAWRALLGQARTTDNRALESFALREIQRLDPKSRGPIADLEQPGPEEDSLDRELVSGHLAHARTLATRSRLVPASLAHRALEVGAPQVALTQAEFVLGADPTNTDAWIAALAAADQLGDAPTYERLLLAPPDRPTPPSPRAAKVLGELIERRAGQDERARWHEASSEGPGALAPGQTQ